VLYASRVSEPGVVVLGEANPDLVLRGAEPGVATGQREVLVDDASLTVGGSGSIFACGLARLGVPTTLCAVVGDDPFGRFMLGELSGRGVDVSAVIERVDEPTGISVILSSASDRGIYTAPGTTASLRASDIGDGLLEAARHVHVASFFLQHALRPDLPGLLARARAAGATTSLDPNWDPAERWDDGLLELLEHVDVFLPNEAEVTRIAGTGDVAAAASALAERGPLVVVKCGGDGALACRGGIVTEAPPVGGVEIVDTTGAGDAFDAGLVRATLEGWPLERALAFANACGALSCRAAGGVDGQPTLEEALALAGREG
jgi:sugar/nucleoside kinase (ribokinase family)